MYVSPRYIVCNIHGYTVYVCVIICTYLDTPIRSVYKHKLAAWVPKCLTANLLPSSWLVALLSGVLVHQFASTTSEAKGTGWVAVHTVTHSASAGVDVGGGGGIRKCTARATRQS